MHQVNQKVRRGIRIEVLKQLHTLLMESLTIMTIMVVVERFPMVILSG